MVLFRKSERNKSYMEWLKTSKILSYVTAITYFKIWWNNFKILIFRFLAKKLAKVINHIHQQKSIIVGPQSQAKH